MARKKTRQQFLLLVIQVLITLIYGAAIIHMTVVLYNEDMDVFLKGVIGYTSQFIILISSLVPQILLRLKKKLHSQDGEIYPLLFMMVSLQSALIIPLYSRITGFYFLDSAYLIVLLRFSMLGTASLFLLSALRFYGFASSRLSMYTILILGSALLFCIIAPRNTVDYEHLLFSSKYDAYLQFINILLYTATIITMIIAAIKDKTSANIKRCLSFIMLIIGMYLAISQELIPTILSSIFYISGIVLLAVSSQESF